MTAPWNTRNPRNAILPPGDRRPRSAIGMIIRWRTEILLAALLIVGFIQLREYFGLIATGLGFAATGLAVTGTSWTRNWVIDHVWCLISRHRLQRLCIEAGLLTRSGRLPLVLWITPTPAGERALIWCRAGISAETFEAFAGEIRAACFARDVAVTRHPNWSHVITLEVCRRDATAEGGRVDTPAYPVDTVDTVPADPAPAARDTRDDWWRIS